MVKERLVSMAKKAAASVILSAAILSIANIDTVWEEQSHRHDYESVRMATRQKLRARLETKAASAKSAPESPEIAHLRESLAQDELGTLNPFAQLTTLDPLTEVIGQGVISFTRQAFRSPQYKEEAGYDLVEYEVEHPDHSKSQILAYLENPLEGDPGAQAVPVVIVMRGTTAGSKPSLFRSGMLVDQGSLTPTQAQALVSQKLNAGIPFFSVSR